MPSEIFIYTDFINIKVISFIYKRSFRPVYMSQYGIPHNLTLIYSDNYFFIIIVLDFVYIITKPIVEISLENTRLTFNMEIVYLLS